jgi:hypothetical protein
MSWLLNTEILAERLLLPNISGHARRAVLEEVMLVRQLAAVEIRVELFRHGAQHVLAQVVEVRVAHGREVVVGENFRVRHQPRGAKANAFAVAQEAGRARFAQAARRVRSGEQARLSGLLADMREAERGREVWVDEVALDRRRIVGTKRLLRHNRAVSACLRRQLSATHEILAGLLLERLAFVERGGELGPGMFDHVGDARRLEPVDVVAQHLRRVLLELVAVERDALRQRHAFRANVERELLVARQWRRDLLE